MDLASWTQLALRNKLPSGLDWLAGRCAACQQSKRHKAVPAGALAPRRQK